jgi:hypothetical protein
MLFRVRGTNKDTHALMVLDIEAVSRPAAQYKAEARGMVVTSLEDIAADAANRPTSVHRGEGPASGSTPDSGGMRNLIVFVGVLLAVAVVGYFMLPLVLTQQLAPPPPPATTQAMPEPQ